VTGNIAEPLSAPFGSNYYYELSAVVGGVEGPRSNEVHVSAPFPGTTVNDVQEQSLKLHGKKESTIVLSFSGALSLSDAENLAAYHLVALGKVKKSGARATTSVKITSATYNAATNTVTLTTRSKLPNQPLQLAINSAAVVDAQGQPIDGNHDGQPGGNFQATFTKAGLKLASVSAASALRPISEK